MKTLFWTLPLAAFVSCASPPEAAPRAPELEPAEVEHVVPTTRPVYDERWAPNVAVRSPAARPAPQFAVRSAAPAPRVDRLAKRVSGLRFDDEDSLRKAMRYLQELTGVDILVEQQAEDAMRDEGTTLNIDVPNAMTLRNALNLVTDLAGDEVTWAEMHGVVVVTTPERTLGDPTLTVYDVSDLVRAIPSYPGRDMNVAPSGGLTPPDEDELEPAPSIHEDLLLDLIMNNIDPDSWDEPGNSITIQDGKLIVRRR